MYLVGIPMIVIGLLLVLTIVAVDTVGSRLSEPPRQGQLEVEAPMILIAMTCVATLFLLIFGALWHQTLMLARRDHSANLS